MFISEHLVFVLRVMFVGSSSPHPLHILFEIAVQVGKQSGGFVLGRLFKEHAFSDLVYFFPQFLTIITTGPLLLKVLKATVCATTT